MRWCAPLLWVVVSAPALTAHQKGLCLKMADMDTCNSDQCPGFHWCDICDACLYEEHAVFKDEL